MASQKVRTRMHGRSTRRSRDAERRHRPELEYEERDIAGVINDAALVASATASVESVLGPGSVGPLPAVVPAFSEDFGSFQNLVPGVIFFLGVSNPEKGIVGMPHTPGTRRTTRRSSSARDRWPRCCSTSSGRSPARERPPRAPDADVASVLYRRRVKAPTTLTYEKSGNVATVTLNRPERMNGMTSLMVREAHDVLAAAAEDDSISVLVLTGAGSSFCPGADLRARHRAGERDDPGGTASLPRSGAAPRHACDHGGGGERCLRRRGIRLGVRLRPAGRGSLRDVQHRLPQRRGRGRHGTAVEPAAIGRRGARARALVLLREVQR